MKEDTLELCVGIFVYGIAFIIFLSICIIMPMCWYIEGVLSYEEIALVLLCLVVVCLWMILMQLGRIAEKIGG